MKKILATLLALSLTFGSLALPATESGISFGDGFSASAETYGYFEYKILEDGNIKITDYSGNDENVVIPDIIDGKKVTSIGDSAFYECTGLTSITIPDSVASISNWAFSDCTNLKSITVDTRNNYYSSENGVLFNKTKSEIICYPIGCPSKEYIIPNSVTSIGKGAFDSCTNLTSLTIPDTVTSIGDNAFDDCSNLANITISKNVTYIGVNAFAGTPWLKQQRKKNSLVVVNGILIDGKTASGKINIPNTVTSIGIGAFFDCVNITEITIPNSVKSIGDDAFYSCTGLKKITMPSGVTDIGASAFYFCSNLTSISIPKGVARICNFCFFGCTKLSSITIPNSVKSIGDFAFEGCTNLNDVFYSGTQNEWKKITIGINNSCLKNASVHYTNSGEISIEKVTNITFSSTDKTVKINWKKVEGASGYRIYAYNLKTKKWDNAATVSANTLSYKQSGLKSGSTYKYKVKAFVKQNGKTYWGESSDTMTTTTKPAKPAIKSASTAKTSIKLNWNSVSGATGYRVYRYDTKAKKWVSVGTVKTTAFKDTKLKSKTSYKYAVKAYRKVGGVNYWSSYSTAKSYKTK